MRPAPVLHQHSHHWHKPPAACAEEVGAVSASKCTARRHALARHLRPRGTAALRAQLRPQPANLEDNGVVGVAVDLLEHICKGSTAWRERSVLPCSGASSQHAGTRFRPWGLVVQCASSVNVMRRAAALLRASSVPTRYGIRVHVARRHAHVQNRASCKTVRRHKTRSAQCHLRASAAQAIRSNAKKVQDQPNQSRMPLTAVPVSRPDP
jgi:hypothetical protein